MPARLDNGRATLERVVALARDRAPEVAVGRSVLAASRSALVGARLPAVANPYLEITAARGDRGVTRDVELRSTLALPFEIAGQRGRRVAEAEAWVSLHQADLERTRALAAGAAVRAWGMAVGESARVDALTELTASATAETRTLTQRRDAGDATEQDVQLAELERSRQLVLLEETRANVVLALGELVRITGIEWKSVPSSPVRAPVARVASTARAARAESAPVVRTHRAEAAYHDRSIARYGRESWAPLNLILMGGRGDFGETRVGVGVGMVLPVFRRLQGERARAEGERDRSLVQADVARKTLSLRMETIGRELTAIRRAIETLDSAALPAARAAVSAASELVRMGKSEYLAVLIARRELASLTLRRLDLAEREWDLLAEWVELSGELP